MSQSPRELEMTGKGFSEVLSLFGQQDINTVPFEGSWTAGQVAEHVLKSVSGILNVLKGKTASTERDPANKIASIKALFLNFDNKLKNPEFLTPTADPKEKGALLTALERKFSGISEVMKTEDLTLTCLEREFPGVGPLTRVEWISLVVYHTERHTHQLNNIRKHFDE
ncbi:MAG: DinB family protein [Bacteroidota bacterium]|nr:DinB family protein [Bacteroidota bacterium]MDP4216361.1 DinB family protein [Bacteroidota bacterium]MDP4247891.1 DinB family protein [Bacteroidota bacterium]MDP4255728.1 DinB family protein [Bacteroidota bacterium]MDP4257464.1 DinB family protein [Bacteroidota bacterium]